LEQRICAAVDGREHVAARIGTDTAAALKAEALRRSHAGEFFGHIAYTSLITSSLL
jgi:hypothetical protein